MVTLIKPLPYPRYTNDYPRVSEIIKATQSATKTQALQWWAAGLGKEEAERQSLLARENGTQFHQQGEDFARGLTEGVSESFNSLFIELGIEPVGVELPVWHPDLKYKGRLDLLFKKDGKYYVLDYKTSKKKREKAYYADARVQLGGYALACEVTYGVEIEGAFVVVAVQDTSKNTPFEVKNLWDFQVFEVTPSQLRSQKKRFAKKVEEFYNPPPKKLKKEKAKEKVLIAPSNPFL